MKRNLVPLAFALVAAGALAQSAPTPRQAEVARRGPDVMPFSLAATQHVFAKTRDGGTQRVVARDPADARQVKLVREHLRTIRSEFEHGDFSGPAHIHGEEMPGLEQLKAARPGELAISYRDVPAGGELAYRARTPALVAAVHAWFDAQVSDHGHDAMAGHDPHAMHHMHGQ